MNRLGVSKNYFKRVFVRARPPLAIEKIGAFRQQYIPCSVYDNPSEDVEATIARINEAADEAVAKALLSENGWDAQTGNYFQNWDSDKNVIRDFVIPDFWLRFRVFDYGSYEPWACIWVAVSPGVEIYDRYLPRGCLVIYREWYGCKAEHPESEADKQVTNLAPKNWTNADMARGIIERTEQRFDSQPTFTDKFPFNNLGGRTIAKEFKDAGIELTLGDTDRKNGWAQMGSKITGEKLIAGSEERWPTLVVFESCKYCQDYIPMIERNPDEGKMWDAQEDGEATHICFTGDTLVITREGNKRIDSILAGDEVLAGDGEYRKVSASGLTRANADIVKLTFDDGSIVKCTPDHKVLTIKGWTVACDCIGLDAIIGSCESKSYQKLFNNLLAVNTQSTQEKLTILAAEIGCIEWFGSITMVAFQKAYTFII
jgi:hypothetical protein